MDSSNKPTIDESEAVHSTDTEAQWVDLLSHVSRPDVEERPDNLLASDKTGDKAESIHSLRNRLSNLLVSDCPALTTPEAPPVSVSSSASSDVLTPRSLSALSFVPPSPSPPLVDLSERPTLHSRTPSATTAAVPPYLGFIEELESKQVLNTYVSHFYTVLPKIPEIAFVSLKTIAIPRVFHQVPKKDPISLSEELKRDIERYKLTPNQTLMDYLFKADQTFLQQTIAVARLNNMSSFYRWRRYHQLDRLFILFHINLFVTTDRNTLSILCFTIKRNNVLKELQQYFMDRNRFTLEQMPKLPNDLVPLIGEFLSPASTWE